MSSSVQNIKDRAKPLKRDLFNGRNLPVYHWSPADKGYRNFGDEIAPMVVRRLLEKSGNPHIAVVEPESGRAKLLSVGSVLHKAEHGDVIWGSGINGKNWPRNIERGISLDIRLVRGPLTRGALVEAGFRCPEHYGDPGLLFPMLFESEVNERIREQSEAPIVYIPNLNDERFIDQSRFKTFKYIRYISPSTSPFEIAGIIAKAELVISSSLHGLVFADYYRVPAIPVASMFEPLYKYVDYFEATGRAAVRVAPSLEEALDGRELRPAEFNCQAIMNAFPLDLIA